MDEEAKHDAQHVAQVVQVARPQGKAEAHAHARVLQSPKHQPEQAQVETAPRHSMACKHPSRLPSLARRSCPDTTASPRRACLPNASAPGKDGKLRSHQREHAHRNRPRMQRKQSRQAGKRGSTSRCAPSAAPHSHQRKARNPPGAHTAPRCGKPCTSQCHCNSPERHTAQRKTGSLPKALRVPAEPPQSHPERGKRVSDGPWRRGRATCGENTVRSQPSTRASALSKESSSLQRPSAATEYYSGCPCCRANSSLRASRDGVLLGRDPAVVRERASPATKSCPRVLSGCECPTRARAAVRARCSGQAEREREEERRKTNKKGKREHKPPLTKNLFEHARVEQKLTHTHIHHNHIHM
jgi:hypothetical protein